MVFIAFSLPGTAGVIAGVTVAMHHLVVKSALFLLAERWGGAIDRLKGAAGSSKLGAALFVLFSLSLLGLPPLPGFWSKFLVLGGLAEAGGPLHMLALATVLSGTVIEGAYLLRVVVLLYGAADVQARPPRHAAANLFGSALFGALLLAAAVMIDPLWQQLNTLAASATDIPAYTQTVLGGTGGTR